MDSLVITESTVTHKPVLVLFQLTVSGVKSQGLASIWDAMPATLKETPPILVFVVPEVVERRFSRQAIASSDSNASSPFEEWDQHVLAVNDKLCGNIQRPVFS